MFCVASLVFMDKYGTHICASSLVILLILLLLGSETLPHCNHTQTLVLIPQAFYSHCFPGVIPCNHSEYPSLHDLDFWMSPPILFICLLVTAKYLTKAT